MASYVWVLPDLALGPAPSARDVAQMQVDGIRDVLDLRAEADSAALYANTDITYYRDPMIDDGRHQPVAAYQRGVGIIEDAIAAGHKALVHCMAGEYRSPSMVYAYLRAIGYSPADAWALITRVRPTAQRQYIQDAENAVPFLPLPGGVRTSGVVTVVALTAVIAGGAVWVARGGPQRFYEWVRRETRAAA